MHQDANPLLSLARFFGTAVLLRTLTGVDLRGFDAHQMNRCARQIVNGMIPFKTCSRFMISAESLGVEQATLLIEACQTLPSLCSVQLIAKTELESTDEQYALFLQALLRLVRGNTAISEAFVSKCLLKEPDRAGIASLVKDNEFVRNLDPSIPLRQLLTDRVAARPNLLYMALSNHNDAMGVLNNEDTVSPPSQVADPREATSQFSE